MNRMIHLSISVFVFSVIVACTPNAPIVTPTIAPTFTPTFTPTIVPTATPTVAPTIPPTSTPTATPTITPFSSEFDANRAMEHARMLAVTIGTRVAGSENDARAGDYIAQQFVSYGYTIERQAFTFQNWEDRGTRVQVTLPETRTIDARPMQFSPPGQVEAELAVIGGVGAESDYYQRNIKGKIALVRRGGVALSDVARNAERAGAVATIIYNNAPEIFAGVLLDKTAEPVVAISGSDGQSLVNLMPKGTVKIKIESDTQIMQVPARNIVATKRGTGNDIIVLGAHYDSVEGAPGANDNGSGVATLLEMARALSQKSHKDTLMFIAFDAEEEGEVGSRHYVASLSDDARRKTVAMLNFDMFGGGSGPLLFEGAGRVAKLAQDAAKELGIPVLNFRLGPEAGSDQMPFRDVGIDVVFFMRTYFLLHTPQDAFDQLRAEYLAEAGREGMRVVEKMEQ